MSTSSSKRTAPLSVLAVGTSEPSETNGNGKGSGVYQLNYISGNIQRFKLIQFSRELEFHEVVLRSKDYCHRNNLRFVFVEPAIQLIDLDDNNGGFIEE